MVIYKKGSLFDAPEGSILVHACNAQGVWGSGIAKEFKKKYPKAFEEYHKFCQNNKEDIIGNVIITNYENKRQVGCLITSNNYGGLVDLPELILDNTKDALFQLMMMSDQTQEYHSNKFNSGLFNVPWEETEKLLNELCEKWKIDWYVWEWD